LIVVGELGKKLLSRRRDKERSFHLFRLTSAKTSSAG
jgi:hypothetical protein